MQDDEITLFNTCTDLVTLKKFEAFPEHLLGNRRPGEWTGVGELCRQIGVAAGDLSPSVFAVWLPDPTAHDGYVVILFYDDDSKWTLAAHYNRARLLGVPQQIQRLEAKGVTVPAASSPTAPPAPAGER
jgi:hypothetical protein